MVDTTQTTTEKNSLKVIFVASSCVLTSFRVHGTSNVCRHWVSASLWYRQFVASTLRTTKLVNKLFAVTEFFNTQPFVAAPILGVTPHWKNSVLMAQRSMTVLSTVSKSV